MSRRLRTESRPSAIAPKKMISAPSPVKQVNSSAICAASVLATGAPKSPKPHGAANNRPTTNQAPAITVIQPPNIAVARLRDIALRVYRACGCRDYARIDIRLDRDNQPFVLEINSMASLGWGGAYVLGARCSGMSFPDLVREIVDSAHSRYFGGPAPLLQGAHAPPVREFATSGA